MANRPHKYPSPTKSSNANSKKVLVLSDPHNSTHSKPVWNIQTPSGRLKLWRGGGSSMHGIMVIRNEGETACRERPLTVTEYRAVLDEFTLIVRKNLTGRRVTFI